MLRCHCIPPKTNSMSLFFPHSLNSDRIDIPSKFPSCFNILFQCCFFMWNASSTPAWPWPPWAVNCIPLEAFPKSTQDARFSCPPRNALSYPLWQFRLLLGDYLMLLSHGGTYILLDQRHYQLLPLTVSDIPLVFRWYSTSIFFGLIMSCTSGIGGLAHINRTLLDKLMI